MVSRKQEKKWNDTLHTSHCRLPATTIPHCLLCIASHRHRTSWSPSKPKRMMNPKPSTPERPKLHEPSQILNIFLTVLVFYLQLNLLYHMCVTYASLLIEDKEEKRRKRERNRERREMSPISPLQSRGLPPSSQNDSVFEIADTPLSHTSRLLHTHRAGGAKVLNQKTVPSHSSSWITSGDSCDAIMQRAIRGRSNGRATQQQPAWMMDPPSIDCCIVSFRHRSTELRFCSQLTRSHSRRQTGSCRQAWGLQPRALPR